MDEHEHNFACSKRLKQMRGLAGVTLNQLSEHAGIPIDTLKTWESVSRRTCLTLIGANHLADAFNELGINVSADWLLSGDDPQPTLKSTQKPAITGAQQAASLYATQGYNTNKLKITDDAMAPFLKSGDWVGGEWQPLQDIDSQLPQLCIIKLTENEPAICRRLSRDQQGQYHAHVINTDSPCQSLYNIKPSRIALLNRLWRD